MAGNYYGRDDYTNHIIIDINNSIVIKILKLMAIIKITIIRIKNKKTLNLPHL